MNIKHFFDPDTFTLTYIVSDPASKDAIIIDPVLDFDPASGTVSDESLKPILHYIAEEKLNIRAILETHAHADHLSSSQLLKQLFPQAILGISEKIKIVQKTFKDHFNIEYLKTDGSQFDRLFKDFEEVQFGTLKMQAIPTPGHTPACMSYYFDGHVFTGDALFMPDYGTGRCDFPRGSASDLYQSIAKNLYSLPDSTKYYTCHDYLPNGRALKFQSTMQIKAETREDEYINFRQERDKTLKAPRLLLPSIQINIDAGKFPPREANDKSYLKLPLNSKVTSGKL